MVCRTVTGTCVRPIPVFLHTLPGPGDTCARDHDALIPLSVTLPRGSPRVPIDHLGCALGFATRFRILEPVCTGYKITFLHDSKLVNGSQPAEALAGSTPFLLLRPPFTMNSGGGPRRSAQRSRLRTRAQGDVARHPRGAWVGCNASRATWTSRGSSIGAVIGDIASRNRRANHQRRPALLHQKTPPPKMARTPGKEATLLARHNEKYPQLPPTRSRTTT